MCDSITLLPWWWVFIHDAILIPTLKLFLVRNESEENIPTILIGKAHCCRLDHNLSIEAWRCTRWRTTHRTALAKLFKIAEIHTLQNAQQWYSYLNTRTYFLRLSFFIKKKVRI